METSIFGLPHDKVHPYEHYTMDENMLHNRNKLWRARKKIFVLVFSDEFPYQVTIRRTYLSRGTYPIRTKVVPFKVD